MPIVSYSQYQLFSSCPHQYKLRYIDKLSKSTANISTIFGTAMHHTIQEFLKTMYGKSKKSALEMDTDALLVESMRTEFIKETEKLNGNAVCSKLELEEHLGDGRRILKWFKTNIDKFYTKSGYELVGIEIPINIEVKPNVKMMAFLDVVLKDVASDEIVIIDIKTSTRGWNKYQKSDKIKNSQLVLYKKFYSDLMNVPLEKIRVEYHILRRKLYDESPYPIPHASKHIPANGNPTVNRVYSAFLEFVNSVFDENGQYINGNYFKNPGENKKNCKWCEFYQKYCDGNI